MQRETQLKNWLAECYPDQTLALSFAAADADFRRYFRATFDNGDSVICMDAPPDKMSIEPYIKVQQLFQAVNVPTIYHTDVAQGFMTLQDFGHTPYLAALEHDSRPEVHKALLLEAIDELVLLQQSSKPGRLPEYDEAVLLRELQLFPDWFVAKELNKSLNFKQKQLWQQTLDVLIPVLTVQSSVYVHRDFIVRNLMLTPSRPGVLDFQDALYGPISYDLVSLLRDAFIEWNEEFVLDLVIRYWEKARAANLPVPAEFDTFYRDFEWMGVQRHLKVAGIFARLYYRDGKDKYRGEIPRFLNYLRKTARRYGALAPLYALLVELVGDEDLQTGYTF
ncbi:N-acetylmuramate/N-acetylglucosamine kinase AmgK [Snodgrassella sp. CFCC 13594]|uniref:N-acetylmuramate/N-acetylglucosamine kinase AmgK n=1 Tax=Snodgrassella sp. CFCC 13594 TaxID=1775559 RepID=UPI0008365496|nr:phosphotransferase [Snodgrassella sp. CFCC 13594]